ncbi:Hypothetical predicted protein [Mytilus galloprovincialis]|uniref:Uncharacterized protein n=1 Tax=Mytilus galloprovincialis TaxID=29158 RepID=A0A8B6FTM7_MYTGA|nr:Hypothetical predicted protein [Mytilus galloprovincialis]
MLKAGFNLRSWTSNNEQLRQQAAKEDVLDTDKQTKILGMRWNVENDELTYAKRTIVPAQGDENNNCEWKYCPTNYNPADLLSRGMTTKQFKESTLWREGPIWIGDKSKHPKTFIETNTALSVLTDDDKEPLDDEESKTCEN